MSEIISVLRAMRRLIGG